MTAVTHAPPSTRAGSDRHSAATSPTRRVRVPLLIGALAATLFAAVLVLYGLSSAADRMEVLRITRDISAGEEITADALAPVGVAVDSASQLVPAASSADVVGKLAAKTMAPGDLVSRTDVADLPRSLAGERRVGAVLVPGRYPLDLRRGDLALATATDGDTSTAAVRVLDLRPAREGVEVVLAVPADAGATVAQLAAQNRLAVVGEPRP
jgi:hypothetical protein